MREIKYTSDGKKVVIIGSLNSQEKIVQEIFVVDGSEIPSGEHFVVKSLHDSPAISWKEKNLKELEDRYEKERIKYSDLISNQDKQYRDKSQLLRNKLEYIGLALKNADEKSFELLVNYICGKITHIVTSQYNPEIIDINNFNEQYDGRLKLLSLFGKDDGSFTYGLSSYSDYSGGHTQIYPFTNYEDAFEKLKYILLSQDVSEDRLKTANKYGLKYSADKMEKYKLKSTESINKNIEEYSTKISKWKESIKSLELL